MQTLDRPPLETLPESRRPARPRPGSAVALGVFLALVAFLASWLLVDLLAGPDYDIDVLLDDYADAWSRGDDAALAELATPGGTTAGLPAGEAGDPSIGGLEGFRFRFSDTPATVLVRDEPFLLVSREAVVAVPGGSAEPMVGIFTIVRSETGFRIVRASWVTAP